MKKRFTEEQNVQILAAGTAGGTVKDVCRQHGICEQTYYGWKRQFGDMDVSAVPDLRKLQTENQRLKRLVADQALDIVMLKDLNSKKW